MCECVCGKPMIGGNRVDEWEIKKLWLIADAVFLFVLFFFSRMSFIIAITLDCNREMSGRFRAAVAAAHCRSSMAAATAAAGGSREKVVEVGELVVVDLSSSLPPPPDAPPLALGLASWGSASVFLATSNVGVPAHLR